MLLGGPTSGSGGGGLAARKGLGMTLNLGGNGNNATTAQSKQRPPIGAGGGIRAMSFTDVSSGSGPLTAPSALGAISSFRPLTRPAYASHTSVSAADSSQSDDSDTHMFRDLLPLDQSNNRHIPRFLRDLFTTPDIKGAIEANFSTVESAERKRLECAFRAMSATDPFSVSDALEAGATRNRYNNIWPFNHNRVRLHVDSSDMDTTTSTEVLSPTPTTTTKCFQGAAVPMARSGSAVIPASSAPPLPSHIKPLKSSVQQRPTSLFDASHSIPPIIPLTNTSSSTITVPGADYINASHILSPAGHRNYIATQGPIPSTFADFWRMTYEQKSQVILMLCADADVQRGSQTCHTYWPDTETTYESITVTKVKEVRVPWKDSVPDQGGCILRLFRLSQGKQPPLETWQIQYLGWPDHGVPSHPDEMLRVHYLLSTLLSRLPEPSPVIVHCSAGVGRTGAFICVDAVLALLTSLPSTSPIPNPFPPSSPTTTSTSWSTVNPILTPSTFTAETPHDMVLAATHHLRSQRVLMVQSLSQFGYCYQVIGRWCALQSLPTTTSASYKETVGTEGVDLVLGEVCPPREEAALLGKRERVGSLDTVQVGGKRS
ncbi:protein-tyrosine phosphatase-like protein [Phlyctochytrium arcticum]|nr:protein-tyrosine phosphatase-like protein [Phlyctochytrium arcticum]